MLAPELFLKLVEAASRAPSPDNMQAWEFRRAGDSIEVFLERRRALPTDVGDMFSWLGIGAAIENLILAAGGQQLAATVTYAPEGGPAEPAAVVRFAPGGVRDPFVDSIDARVTNRRPYRTTLLGEAPIARLTEAMRGCEAGLYWLTTRPEFKRLSSLEAHSLYIRVEHRPLHDELYDSLRFTRAEVQQTRYGLAVDTLEVPAPAVLVLKSLRRWSAARAASHVGLSRAIAASLAALLRKVGAICLVTARRRSPAGYMEAGRAMQRIWLAATAQGLAVHPFGALPQYLTKVQVEPDTFLPKHAAVLRRNLERFRALFPGARDEHPGIVLRIGQPVGPPSARNVRLPAEQLVRS